jgi:hypothetical protein
MIRAWSSSFCIRIRSFLEAVGDNGIERIQDKLIHQLRCGVVGASGLAVGTEDEGEAWPARAGVFQRWMEFEETLVNGAEFLDIERCVVDPTRD